ncbi:MAG: hypothetical protein KAG61_11500 [Bacteriovoracaceae bacterium]|nr:hypothetical protein [Bacteriovoracaceae bacterium]
MLKKLIYTLIILIQSFALFAASESIPMKSIRTPSNDLIMEGTGILTPEEAWALERDGQVDLTELNPEESVLWSDYYPQELSNDFDRIDIHDNDKVRFEGSITSQSSIYRFNVAPVRGVSGEYFTVMLEKRLHTTLLRKNLLRKMGYVIPAMKYLKKLTVHFDSIDQKEAFLKEIPNATYGAPQRWVTEGPNSEQLFVTLQDIAVMTPKQSDHYNLAMGVPPRTLMSRTLRSLITPYALCDIPESINKMTWKTGRISNEKLILPHFTLANMNPTLSDVKWSLRRISKLSREDFVQIVRGAHYPKSVELVVVEKLIERRNSLNMLLEENAQRIEIDEDISFKDELKNGHLTKEGWDGYAANFTHGAPDSPFKDLGMYILSEIQSEVIPMIAEKINEFLVGFDLSKARYAFMIEEFNNGLSHFLKTGEILEKRISTWSSPILNGNLIFSRDIVIGNQFGTDHLVQLADNFGFNIKLGAYLGIENLPYDLFGNATADLSLTKTFTHLKPVTTLKESLKEPYKNMIVPYYQRKLQKGLSNLGNFEGENQDEINDLMDYVNKNLGVGETLITTERVGLSAALQATLRKEIHAFTVRGSAAGILIKRTQIYRKSADQIQVYIENGSSRGMGISFTYSALIPVIRFEGRASKGKYNVEIYNLNINPDITKNPNLKGNARALSYLIDEGSSELIKAISPPFSLQNHFNDSSFRFSLLNWKSKYLNKTGEINLRTPEGKEIELIKITAEKASGFDNDSFSKDIVNNYIGLLTTGSPIEPIPWARNTNSYKRIRKKRISRFEARKQGNKLTDRFMAIQKTFQGWKISSKNLHKLIKNKIEGVYQTPLFDHFAIKEATGLMLYNVTTNINIYERGIERLKNTSYKTLRRFQKSHGYAPRVKGCTHNKYTNKKCGKLNLTINKKKRCDLKFKKNKLKEGYACMLDVITRFEKELKFKDFNELIGKENIYIFGSINGFRKESEILNEPIESNTIGRVSGRFWNGPVEHMRSIIDITGYSFDGSWLRETL